MKAKWYEWIPIYGWFKYLYRYLDCTKYSYKEVVITEWMNFYHITIATLAIIILISFFI